MKKALAIISAFSLVASMAIAEMPAPKTSFGFEGSAKIKLANGDETQEKDTGKYTDGAFKSTFTPKSLNASAFDTKANVGLDWTNFGFTSEAKYDAFNTDESNYSYFKSVATIKDFFGLKVEYTFKVDNQDTLDDKGNEIENPATNAGGNIDSDTNEIKVSFDKLKSDGYSFYTKYEADAIFQNMNVASVGVGVQNVFAGFKEVGFEAASDELAGKFVVKNDTAYAAGNISTPKYKIDTAKITFKKMFGIWTSTINDNTAPKLRMDTPGAKVSVSREGWSVSDVGTNGDEARSYRIGWYKPVNKTGAGHNLKVYGDTSNKLFSNGKMNLENTITPVKGLEVKVSAIAYDGKTSTVPYWRDYLKGRGTVASDDNGAPNRGTTGDADDNLTAQVAYTLDNVGTFAAGAVIRQDYKVTTQVANSKGNFVDVTAPSSFKLSGASADQRVKGTSFWVDANLSKILGEKNGLYVYFDGTAINYMKTYKFNEAFNAAGNKSSLKADVGTALEMYIGAEAFMNIGEALRVDVATQVATIAGYDYKNALNGKTWEENNKDQYTKNGADKDHFLSNFSAANSAADTYNYNPFVIKARGQFKVNDTFTPWAKDEFVMVAGDLNKKVSGITGLKDIHGYFHKNTIALGVDLTANKKTTIGVEADFYQYVGVPNVSKLYKDGLSDDQKKSLKAEYEDKVASKLNPFELSLKYTYKF